MSIRNKLRTLVILSLLTIFFGVVRVGHAQEYQSHYNVTYKPLDESKTEVELTVSITNLRSAVFVREIALTFPDEFPIENIVAKINNQSVTLESQSVNKRTTFRYRFGEDSVGKGLTNRLEMHYIQRNVLKNYGKIWELTIPPMSGDANATSKITFAVPEQVSRVVSIAKPVPIKVNGTNITWENVGNRTIYAVFGTEQSYKLDLAYLLYNDSFLEVEKTIALPPETLYQSIYIDKLEPNPLKVTIDDDGNFMAHYKVPAKRKLSINFSGFVTVFSKPQEEMKSYTKQAFQNQKTFLTNPVSFWSLGGLKIKLPHFDSVEKIYQFVTSTLEYDLTRVSTKAKRIGAKGILETPKNAVCMEYTDSFIALTRADGIPSREINGFGYSNNSLLRPPSLGGDILHAWPEYYDKEQHLWIPVDPTWEDTSFIDYFNSFDLNHIAFAIHGKNPIEPLPAGMYKLTSSQDVSVQPTTSAPTETNTPEIQLEVKKTIESGQRYKATLVVSNQGKTFIKQASIKLAGTNLNFSPTSIPILLLAPGQRILVPIVYLADSVPKSTRIAITIRFNDTDYANKTVSIQPQGKGAMGLLGGIILGSIAVTVIYLLLAKRQL